MLVSTAACITVRPPGPVVEPSAGTSSSSSALLYVLKSTRTIARDPVAAAMKNGDSPAPPHSPTSPWSAAASARAAASWPPRTASCSAVSPRLFVARVRARREDAGEDAVEEATRSATTLCAPARAARWSGVSSAALRAARRRGARRRRSDARSACPPAAATWRSVFPPAVQADSRSGAAGSARSALTSRRSSPLRAARSSAGPMVGGAVAASGRGVGQGDAVVVGVDGGDASGEAIEGAGVGCGAGEGEEGGCALYFGFIMPLMTLLYFELGVNCEVY